MSHEVNDEHKEIISATLTTIVQNYVWLRDYIAKWELENFLTEADKKYLATLEKALKEYKKHV